MPVLSLRYQLCSHSRSVYRQSVKQSKGTISLNRYTLFYVSCVRSVIDYAAPVFFNGLPQYLKKELVRLEKRAISIITSGKCNSAIEVGLTPILEHYYVLCSRLFDNIVSDPNHKLKALLPPDYDNSRYNLRRQRHFNMPKLCTNRTSNTFIYAMSKQSGL